MDGELCPRRQTPDHRRFVHRPAHPRRRATRRPGPLPLRLGQLRPWFGGRGAFRRSGRLNKKATDGHPKLFDTHRHHAFFNTVDTAVLDSVAADKSHRKHAIIEQINADLKDSALAHMPSGVVAAVTAYNLTGAGTIRRKLTHIPTRIASSARKTRLHLPENWPRQTACEELFTSVHAPPQAA